MVGVQRPHSCGEDVMGRGGGEGGEGGEGGGEIRAVWRVCFRPDSSGLGTTGTWRETGEGEWEGR